MRSEDIIAWEWAWDVKMPGDNSVNTALCHHCRHTHQALCEFIIVRQTFTADLTFLTVDY
eukprot:scaffold9876_cov77-Cyclotella_meneghiniana.AAC.3